MQMEKMTVEFRHKHVQRQTGHIIHCPTAVWDCTRQAQSHEARTTPAPSHSLCPWLYVRYGPATVMIQHMWAPSHLPLLLPLLLDKPTRTARCRVAWRPSIALFFCDGDATRLPLPIYPPLLSSCDLLAHPLWPFSPSRSPPFYVAAPVPPLASATRAQPSSARSGAVYRFSPLVWEFVDLAPPQLLTH